MNRKIYFLFLFFLFLASCSDEKAEKLNDLSVKNLDTLLSKARNEAYSKKQRLYYTDKAFEIVNASKNDSLNRRNHFKIANRYFELYELDKYLAVSRKSYSLALESNDSSNVPKALYYIGDFYFEKANNDSAYYYYSKAEKLYQKLNDKENLAKTILYKAYIMLTERNYIGSEIATIRALGLAKEIDAKMLSYECNVNLGSSLLGMDNFNKSLEYHQKAFLELENLKKEPQYEILKAQTFNNIGVVYQHLKQYGKAVETYQNALKINNLDKIHPAIFAAIIDNLAYSKFKMGNNTVSSMFRKSLKIRDSLQIIPGIVINKIHLAEYYLAQKDTVKALEYINDANAKAYETKNYRDELASLELLAKIEPKKAAVYNKDYIKLSDSLQNMERATRNKFARIEFETDEILTQKNNIEAEKNKISSQRWLILGLSSVLLLIIALLYITKVQHARNKELQFEKDQQKANEEIYQLMLDQKNKIDEGREKEKKRIAQELHDGVMSKLTSTRLNLFILSKKTDEETIKKCLSHIENIQNIEKEIRSISHDLSKDIFSGKDSFETIVDSLFEEQKSISEANYHLEIDTEINWDAVESTTKMHLYRIFQEALQNINKYAKAKNVRATITKLENRIHIEIADDGIGFDVKKTKEGIGLKNMQSRIKIVEGEIKVQSQKGEGTQIDIYIPG
ncbi:MAG: ATP-binding protein [Flavobacterium sp.]